MCTWARVLNLDEVRRLGEFFDDDLHAVFELVRDTWMPNAQQMHAALLKCIAEKDACGLRRAADQLRESSLGVGADKIAFYATNLELVAVEQRWNDARLVHSQLGAALQNLARWFSNHESAKVTSLRAAGGR